MRVCFSDRWVHKINSMIIDAHLNLWDIEDRLYDARLAAEELYERYGKESEDEAWRRLLQAVNEKGIQEDNPEIP